MQAEPCRVNMLSAQHPFSLQRRDSSEACLLKCAQHRAYVCGIIGVKVVGDVGVISDCRSRGRALRDLGCRDLIRLNCYRLVWLDRCARRSSFEADMLLAPVTLEILQLLIELVFVTEIGVVVCGPANC